MFLLLGQRSLIMLCHIFCDHVIYGIYSSWTCHAIACHCMPLQSMKTSKNLVTVAVKKKVCSVSMSLATFEVCTHATMC